MILSSSLMSGTGIDDVNTMKSTCSNKTSKNGCCNSLEETNSSDHKKSDSCLLTWHPVSKKMSNISYRNKDCIEAIKIEKIPSIKSFFSKVAKNTATKTKQNKTSLKRKKQSGPVDKRSKTATDNLKKRNFFQNHFKVKGNEEKSTKFIHGSILEKSAVSKQAGTEKDKIEVIDMTLGEDQE
mmetsp:Transcript_14322/g.21694  ORF Transcript_14322/g.21694 Transcript_14322/m.21694 type:complete len:182 (+) Transcript_14322:3-548(+)